MTDILCWNVVFLFLEKEDGPKLLNKMKQNDRLIYQGN